MKTFIVITMLLLLSISSYAQIIGPQFKMFPPIKKELKLQYFGKPSSPVLKPLTSPESITSRLKKPVEIYKGFSKEKSPARLRSGMPIMKPDSTINFHILAIRPDSAIHNHLQIRKVK